MGGIFEAALGFAAWTAAFTLAFMVSSAMCKDSVHGMAAAIPLDRIFHNGKESKKKGRYIMFLWRFVHENIPPPRYIGVGVACFSVEIAVLNILMVATGLYEGIMYAIFRVIGYATGHSFRFFLNRRYVFGSKNILRTEIKRYAGVISAGVVMGTVISAAGVYGARSMFGAGGWWWANGSAIAGDAAASIWDWLGNKHIVFAKCKEMERRGDCVKNESHIRSFDF